MMIEKITLTASGGPFLNWTEEMLRNVRPDEALRHPNWDMGCKVTIDSASLMNKGLEVIEARWLFDLTPEQISVIVHPAVGNSFIRPFHGWICKSTAGGARYETSDTLCTFLSRQAEF